MYLRSPSFYQIGEYNIEYNGGKINQADGVVIYIKKCLKQETKVESIGKLKFLILLLRVIRKTIKISPVYSCQQFDKARTIKNGS